MKISWVLFCVFLMLCLGGCTSLAERDEFVVFSSYYDFSDSPYDWVGGFADYKTSDSTINELAFEYTELPPNIADGKKSLKISGTNRGEVLFMFIKKKITGLNPNTQYTLAFEIELAPSLHTLDASQNYTADSLYLKVGASEIEPQTVIQDNYIKMNVDKGLVNSGGENMIILATITGSELHGNLLINKRNANSSYPYFTARTNSNGEMWVIVGTDTSSKEAIVVYYSSVEVVFSLVE